MSNAEPRFADRLWIGAGTHHGSTTGLPIAAAWASVHGSGARSRLLRASQMLALVAAAFTVLCCFASSAHASFIHPTTNYSFGSDGTPGTSLSGPKSLAYNQATNRIYALTNGSGSKISGWSFNGPESFSPLGGSFPFELEAGANGDPEIDVDNSGTSTQGDIYYTPDYGAVYAFSPSGSPLSKQFEPAEGEICGLAVDGEGNIWVGNYHQNAVEELPATSGAPIRVVEGAINVCHIAVDPSTGDVYAASYGGGVMKFEKSAGYAKTLEFSTGFDPRVTVDAAHQVVYIASEGKVTAYSTSGGQLEEFGVGGIQDVVVDESTDTVFTLNTSTGKIQEWPGVPVPSATVNDPPKDNELTGAVELAGGGEVTECYFEWRKTSESSYPSGNKLPCSPAAPYTGDKPLVSATISGLEPEVSYTFRLAARDANGIGYSGQRQLIPHHVAVLRTGTAAEIERQCATLHASFEGNGEKTTYWFKYGPTTQYGSETTAETTEPAAGVHEEVSTKICGLTAAETYHYRVVAENGLGESEGSDRSFTTQLAVKDVVTGTATKIGTSEATLNGSLDPDGLVTHYYFEYGKTEGYGQIAPALPGGEVGTTAPQSTPVSTEIGNLEPGTTYHFRLVGTNVTGSTAGKDETFTTPGPPTIVSFASTNVTATSAELVGRVNPNGYETTYWFEYGTTPEYGQKAPVPAGTLGAVNAVEPIGVPISNLQGVTYHFRLVAESKWGKVMTEDQTFDFFPPRGCPNENERQQTGAGYLPDCRAYELVSAGRAGGAIISPEGPTSAYASNPGRFVYTGSLNAIPGTGAVSNGSFGDLYVASRTSDGWHTRYLGIPGYESLGYSGSPEWQETSKALSWLGTVPTDLGMNRFLIWNRIGNGFTIGNGLKGSDAPYIFDNEGNELGRLPTNLFEVPNATLDMSKGGYKGSAMPSADFTHYVFSTNGLAFAPGGNEAEPGSVYDDNLQTGALTVISKTADNEDISKDPAYGQSGEYIKVEAVSKDGSHVLMSTRGGPNEAKHLYMSINDTAHYEVSLGKDGKNHAVQLVGMTSDGSKVLFTSAEQLTPDDTDNSTDLYMWSAATHSVTRLSTGSGTSGNSDNCGASWISGCGVEVVPTPSPYYGNPTEDRAYAADAGDVYFYSPEQLDGSRGLLGRRNLYVAHDGSVLWVATLEVPESKAISRIDVSPNGKYMAMITRTPLTAYETAGHSEMYRFSVGNRSILCVSCNPSGQPPKSDVKGSQNGIFMTEDGRTFFSTKDALEPRDSNGIADVYEYAEGRARLISTGTGDEEGTEFAPIGLIGVSMDGRDVFFSTYQTLVPEDENGDFRKIYDARTAGGFPYNKPPAPCAAADECHGPETTAPANPVISTGAKLGSSGNVHPARQRHKRHCRKHTKRCHHKRKARHRKAARRGHRG